ncbi:DNA-binding transcriptional LysR family regulator [Deinococcus metalli]|uniref:DNA-binding transcriptional LysR family regulator n=1 Tax=Deinococcus metalli TaxID=1141878 RepID=A0A7W8NSI1_9DEIO|nr:LysR family transcriptional regulator [Deinococcus metalli]MBB5378980.1 DNA-binding transcriptional LysR family regulator [Deinococcus metalli]GHF63611.1 LysR family transcriptional regulator [Deinococcus metalli]
MRINPEYLVTFNVVAELGSVSKAAEYLNLSQPAVSGQLRALHTLIGEPLYIRHARGITLTPAGFDLLPHAQTLARTMKRVSELAHDKRHRLKTQVQLGVSWTLAPRAVHLAAAFQRGTPTVTIQAAHTPELIARVGRGELDAALTVDASQVLPEGLEARRFSSEDLRLIVPPGHVLNGQGYAPLHALAGEVLLLPMVESSVRKRAAKLLDHAGVSPWAQLELGSFLAVKDALVRGVGVAILPRSLVDAEVDHGLLASVGLESPEVTLGYHAVSAPLALLPTTVREVLDQLTR